MHTVFNSLKKTYLAHRVLQKYETMRIQRYLDVAVSEQKIILILRVYWIVSQSSKLLIPEFFFLEVAHLFCIMFSIIFYEMIQ